MANDFSGDSSCKALWRMESGALTADSKGTNTLTDNNTVGTDTVNYKEGAASADFEKDNTEYFSIADGDLDSGFPLKGGESNKTILVCVWATIDSFASNIPHLFAKYAVATGKRSFAMVTYADKAQLLIGYNNGDSYETIVHASTLVTGRWYHFGMWFDDTDKSYGIRIWDDTAQAIVGTDKTGIATNNIYVSNTVGITIGSRHLGDQVFDGLMDEVVVFDAITADPAGKIDEIRAGTYGAGIFKTVSDTGAGSDALANIGASFALAESGSGVDTPTNIGVSLALVDTGSGIETFASAISAAVAELGSGVDALNAAIQLAVTDSGSGIDQLLLQAAFQIQDSGSGVDAVNVITVAIKTVIDSAIGIDSIGPVSVSIPISDSGSGLDAVSAISVIASVIDQAVGADVIVKFQAGINKLIITFSVKVPSISMTSKKPNITIQ